MKKAIALLATAGMLTAPLAVAQNDVPAPQADDKPDNAVQADTPKSGGASGLAESLGVSNTVLAVGAAAALAVAIGVAADSSGGSSSSSTGTN